MTKKTFSIMCVFIAVAALSFFTGMAYQTRKLDTPISKPEQKIQSVQEQHTKILSPWPRTYFPLVEFEIVGDYISFRDEVNGSYGAGEFVRRWQAGTVVRAVEVTLNKPENFEKPALDGTYVSYEWNANYSAYEWNGNYSDLRIHVRTASQKASWEQCLRNAQRGVDRAYKAKHGPRDVVPACSRIQVSKESLTQ